MKEGVAVEQGSHDELMDHKGIYYDLVTGQVNIAGSLSLV